MDSWGNVFSTLQDSSMSVRASEYADAVAELKSKAERLKIQRSTVQSACEQLLHTAYREALKCHLKAMLDAASSGSSKEAKEGAQKTLEELCPADLLDPPAEPSKKEDFKAVAEKFGIPGPVTLGIGLPQPGVEFQKPEAVLKKPGAEKPAAAASESTPSAGEGTGGAPVKENLNLWV